MASDITSGDGSASVEPLAGSSTADSAITAAAGVATVTPTVGSSTADSAITAAAGVATSAPLAGKSAAAAARVAADGAATTAPLAGKSAAAAARVAATGTVTTSPLVGSFSVAIIAASVVATTADLVGSRVASVMSPSAGTAATSSLAGSSIAISDFVIAEGVAISGILEGVPVVILFRDFVTGRMGHLVLGAFVEKLYTDLSTDDLYAVVNDKIHRYFHSGRRTGTWRSKKIVLREHPNLAWIRLNGPMEGAATVRIYGDGVLWHTSTVSLREPQRLPSGRHRHWEIEVESDYQLTSVALASTTVELFDSK